jgi:hypothetical protein
MALLPSAAALLMPLPLQPPTEASPLTRPVIGPLIYDTTVFDLLVMKTQRGWRDHRASPRLDFGGKVWANVIDVFAFLDEAPVERKDLILKEYTIVIMPRISCAGQVCMRRAYRLAPIFVDVFGGRAEFLVLGFP